MFNRKKKSEQKILDDARKKTEALLETLMQNKDALTPQQQDELKAMIAAAGIAGSTMKAAQAIRKADDFGDRMHQQTMDMIEKAHDLSLKNPPPPTIDPKKLMDAADRLQKIIERENEDREKRLKQLEETSKKLKASSEELLKTAEQMLDDKKKKAMSAAEEKKRDAEWRKQGCPVTKPVTVGKPLKLKKPAP